MQFGALQGDHAADEVFVNGQLVEHLLAGRNDPVLGGLGVGRGEDHDELVSVDAGLREDLGVVAERVGFIEHVAEREPLLVAVFSPFGEVLLRDGSSVEELVDDLHDFGFGVEPCDEFVSGVAGVDAIVEFVPDCSREVCDFTVACFHMFSFVCVVFLMASRGSAGWKWFEEWDE